MVGEAGAEVSHLEEAVPRATGRGFLIFLLSSAISSPGFHWFMNQRDSCFAMDRGKGCQVFWDGVVNP